MNATIKIEAVRPGTIVKLDNDQVVGVVSKSIDAGSYGLVGVDGETAWVHNTRAVEVVDMAALKAYRAEVAAKSAAVKAARAAAVNAGMVELSSMFATVFS